MCPNAQRDGRPAEYRWRPLFNAAVWLTPTTRVPCSNAAKMRNPLKLHGVPKTNETISAASGLKFTILWGHVEEILLLNKFFPIVDTCLTTTAAQPGQTTAYKILGPSDLTNSRKALWQSLFPEHENSDYLRQWQT